MHNQPLLWQAGEVRYQRSCSSNKERIEVEERTKERLSIDRLLRSLYEPKVCIKRASIEKDLADRLGCSVYG